MNQNAVIPTEKECTRMWYNMFYNLEHRMKLAKSLGFTDDDPECNETGMWAVNHLHITGFVCLARKVVFGSQRNLVQIIKADPEIELRKQLDENRLIILDLLLAGKINATPDEISLEVERIKSSISGRQVNDDLTADKILEEANTRSSSSTPVGVTSQEHLSVDIVSKTPLTVTRNLLFSRASNVVNYTYNSMSNKLLGRLVRCSAVRVLSQFQQGSFDIAIFAPPHSGKSTLQKKFQHLVADSDTALLWSTYRRVLVTNVLSLLKYGKQSFVVLPTKRKFFERLTLRRIEYSDDWYDGIINNIPSTAHILRTDEYILNIPEILNAMQLSRS